MIPASPPEQQKLLALQHLDTAIRQLEHRRAHLPEQQALDEHERTHRKVAGELSRTREELQQAERQQARLEQEINQVEARRKSEEGRMYSGSITSEREVEAIRNELSALKSRKYELEDALLDVMERVEELTKLRATLEQRDQELASATEGLRAARDEAATEIDEQLQQRRAEREQTLTGLDADLVRYYEDLRERKNGLAVTRLQGRTCDGCHLDLTPIEMEETRAQAQRGFTRCPQCDRLLVLD